MTDHNIRRLRDELSLYKRANDQQARTIERLRRSNLGLKRAVERLEGQLEAQTPAKALNAAQRRAQRLWGHP